MHIAVLVFGRLDKCVDHYENILDSIGREHTIDFFGSSDNSNEIYLNDFIRLYKPILYTNDPIQHDYDFNGYRKSIHLVMNNMIRHFINKDRVFTLLEQHMEKDNTRYDIAISLRVDLLFRTHFIFNDILDNTVYIPKGYDYEGGINDQLAYGKIDVMKKYMNIIHNCIHLLENNLSIVHPETLHLANIHFHNINVCRFDLSYVIDR